MNFIKKGCSIYHENIIQYGEFLGGEEVCDWGYSVVECEECKEKFEIDDISWD